MKGPWWGVTAVVQQLMMSATVAYDDSSLDPFITLILIYFCSKLNETCQNW